MARQGICPNQFQRFDLQLSTKWKEDNETNSSKCKKDFIQFPSIMILCTQSSTQSPIIPNKCCRQCASNPPEDWATMARIELYPQIIYNQYHQLFHESATVTVSVETQLLSRVFRGSPQLTLHTIVYSPDTPPQRSLPLHDPQQEFHLLFLSHQ